MRPLVCRTDRDDAVRSELEEEAAGGGGERHGLQTRVMN